MTNIRRYFQEGHVYFLTHVTDNRMPILVEHIDLLMSALERTRSKWPFELIAWSVLPDHIHMVVNPAKENLSPIVKAFKLSFSNRYRDRMGVSTLRVWQNRYWDHVIRNEEDLRNHIEYTHYNPVKHGLVRAPLEYKHSSFLSFVENGVYDSDWGSLDEFRFEGDFGE